MGWSLRYVLLIFGIEGFCCAWIHCRYLRFAALSQNPIYCGIHKKKSVELNQLSTLIFLFDGLDSKNPENQAYPSLCFGNVREL